MNLVGSNLKAYLILNMVTARIIINGCWWLCKKTLLYQNSQRFPTVDLFESIN